MGRSKPAKIQNLLHITPIHKRISDVYFTVDNPAFPLYAITHIKINERNIEMNNIWILAETAEQEGPSGITSEPVTAEGEATTVVPDSNAPAAKSPLSKPFGSGSLIWLAVMFVLFYFILFRGPHKKQQQQKQLVQSLKKNDRVRTIGGILGTIVDIKDDEITLKVDEANNTKIKIASSAIGKKLSKDED